MTAPTTALDGLVVREATHDLAGTFGGHLLAGLGAAVHRDAESAFPILDRRKRIGTPACADAVVADESAAADGAPIACSVRAWGRTGPRTSLPPDEALVQAATGLQAQQWSWSGRPVWLATPMVSYMTGMLAALGLAAAHLGRLRGLSGQALHTSGLQAGFALNGGTYVTGPTHQSALLIGGDPRGVYPSYSLYPTADGWLFLGALTQPFWVKLATFLDRVDLLVDERLQGNPLTFGAPALRAFVRGELDPVFARRTTADWVHALREADIPCGAVQSRDEFLRDPELRASGLVGDVWEPPPAASIVAGSPATRRTVPPRDGCLEGIRVLDLTSFIAGPVCPMLLGDLGADVIKIETLDGDPFRMTAYGFHGWNRGKRSLVLDLKRPEGRDALLDLARSADVLVENFRGGVMERLGLDWERLRAINPALVVVSITGAEGDLATLPGFDPVFQARSGFMTAQGGADEPVFHMVAYNDYSAGTLGALAAVAALVARERDGCGQRVTTSLMRTALVDQAAHMTVSRPGGRDHLGPSAARRLYACADGWLCIATQGDDDARGLGRLAGVDVPYAAPPDGPEADRVAAALADGARADALDRLASLGVPAAPCLAFAELLSDPHVEANGMFVTLADPALGAVTLGGPLIDFERTPIRYRRLGPGHGAHSREVLAEVGYDAARIASLVAAGVVPRVKPLPVALAATLHDTTGALRSEIAWALPRLSTLYASVAVTTSPPTSKRLVADLRAAGIYGGSPPSNTRGPLYRLAVRQALRANARAVHYLDFDRALHWLRVAPRELRAVLSVALKHPALLIGRTDKAHASHHRPLWATEVVANRLMADHLAVRGRMDFLVPSFVLVPGVARELVRRSRARDDDVYGELAALVPALAPDLAYIECRGLDWETPDRHRRAVRRVGLATWRRRQETPAEWALRTALAARIVGGFERTRRRMPGTPRVVRLRPRTVR